MATRSTEAIAQSGLAATYHAASAGGDKVTPADRTFLHVKNASGSSVTVTVTTPGTESGLAIADLTVAVPAGEQRFIPVPPRLFKGSDGLASIAWSATTSITFAVVRL